MRGRAPADRLRVGLLASALTVILAGCGHRAASSSSSSVRHLEFGGLTREYRLDLPALPSDGSRVPIIVALHGGGSTGPNLARNSHLDTRGPAAGFAVAYPNGIGRGWDAGYCCGPAAKHHVDDIGFIDAMLDDIGRHFPVQVGRVSALGFSNGGDLAYLLACRRASRFAAIAVGGTGLPPSTPCRPERAVGILHFHGTADRYHPYFGGPSASAQADGAILRSVPGTIREWARLDACPHPPQTTYAHGAARCATRAGCADRTQVVLCTVRSMGHQWPGGRVVLRSVLGPGTVDLDATGMALGFLKREGRAP